MYRGHDKNTVLVLLSSAFRIHILVILNEITAAYRDNPSCLSHMPNYNFQAKWWNSLQGSIENVILPLCLKML